MIKLTHNILTLPFFKPRFEIIFAPWITGKLILSFAARNIEVK